MVPAARAPSASAARRGRERRLGPAVRRARCALALAVLIVLIFSKYFYLASLTSYYTFYLIHRFGVSVQSAQLHLFVFLGAVAAGTIIGGPIGDRFGRKYVIWGSILGVLPFTLALPYVNLFWTGVLTVPIGLILASAFSAILVYAQELLPGKVGMISGLFFGLAFGIAGIGAAVLGRLADATSIEFVYHLCSYLPALGLLTALLPDLESDRRARRPDEEQDVRGGSGDGGMTRQVGVDRMKRCPDQSSRVRSRCAMQVPSCAGGMAGLLGPVTRVHRDRSSSAGQSPPHALSPAAPRNRSLPPAAPPARPRHLRRADRDQHHGGLRRHPGRAGPGQAARRRGLPRRRRPARRAQAAQAEPRGPPARPGQGGADPLPRPPGRRGGAPGGLVDGAVPAHRARRLPLRARHLDIKDEAADLVANLIRLKSERYVPERDIIVALTDDEEGGDDNGAAWLLANRPELVRAAYVINTDAGGGQMQNGPAAPQSGADQREDLRHATSSR